MRRVICFSFLGPRSGCQQSQTVSQIAFQGVGACLRR